MMPKVHALALVQYSQGQYHVMLQNEVEESNRNLGYFVPIKNGDFYKEYEFSVKNWETKITQKVTLYHDGNGIFHLNFEKRVFIFRMKYLHVLGQKHQYWMPLNRKKRRLAINKEQAVHPYLVKYKGKATHPDFSSYLVEIVPNNLESHEELFEETKELLLGSDTYNDYELCRPS